jgi:hypothetical protein
VTIRPKLFHYAADPVEQINSVAQQPVPWRKPAGLWVSAETGNGDSWNDWCRAEDYNLESLATVHEIELRPDANLLWITDEAGVLELTGQHGLHDMAGIATIDWAAVARHYQGIVIAPYIRSLRLDPRTTWYYTWDCASGCIWDADAIAGIKLIE